ncbi:MotE family protein [Rummeliibacillus pycnus]|uniref:MotE family protein n=1 Tax=Rummeliibacillus pycnus TaxID=101070 RepID=UPI003D2A8A6C
MTTKPRKKVSKQKVQVEEVEKEKKPSFIQKLFFWGIIPLLFVSAVLLIAAEVTGTNVFEKAKEITGTSSSQEKAKDVTKFNSNNEKQIADLKAQVQEKDAEIAKLQGEVEDSKSETSKMAIEKHRLEVQIKKMENGKDEIKQEFSSIVTTYEKMTPKKAAPVITNMKDAEALKILSSLKPETLAAILEKMPADKAAHYTELLSKNN